MKMIMLSMKRRRKDIFYVALVTFAASLFMAGLILFQGIMNRFVMERNYQNYGEWILSSIGVQLEHPYFEAEGKCETAAAAVDEKGRKLAYIGSVDEALQTFGNIRLYEGRMPQADDEVVMDLPSLSKMGYSYELGQEIAVMWQEGTKENLVTKEKTYRLVGTMHSFASAWMFEKKHNLPGILVTQKEAEQYPGMHTTWYYKLDRSYEDINADEFSNAFQQQAENAELIIYNAYVYGNTLWGSPEMFRYVSYAMIAVSAFAIAFLLASYTSGRRSVYYRYRCMGASIWDVRLMIVTECLYATLPAAAAGFLMAYLLGYLGSVYAAFSYELPQFFKFDAGMFIRQTASVAIVIFVSITGNILGIRDKSLAQETADVPQKKFAMLRKRAKKKTASEKDFIRRYNKMHPVSRVMFVLFSVGISAFIMMCSNKVNEALFTRYGQHYRYGKDFSMEAEGKFKIEFNDEWNNVHTGTVKQVTDGITQDELMEFADIYGIDKTVQSLTLEMASLDWEGKENSPVRQYLKEMFENSGQTRAMHEAEDYEVRVQFMDAEIACQAVAEFGDASEINWNSWDEGNQIVVIWRTVFYDEERNAVEIYDESLQKGMQVYLATNGHVTKDAQITAEVAAVYHGYRKQMNKQDIYIGYYLADSFDYLYVIAPRRLAWEMAEQQTAEEFRKIETNGMSGQFSRTASFESTEKQLAQFAKKYDMTYSTAYAELRRMNYQSIIQDLAIYGSLMVLVLCVFLILQKNFSDSIGRYRSKQYQLLRKIGMSEQAYMKMTMVAACKDYLWIVAGAVVGYLAAGMMYYRQIGESAYMYSHILDIYTNEPIYIILEYFGYYLNPVWTVGVILLMFGLLVLNTYWQTKKYLRNH